MYPNIYIPLLIFFAGVVIYAIARFIFSRYKKEDDVSVKKLNTIFYKRHPDKFLSR